MLTNPPTSVLAPSGTGASVDRSARTAGLAALAFVGVVVLQNVIRGSAAPSTGASAQEVLTHYADHRATTFLLTATFVLSGFALALFLGGVASRLLGGARRAWAATGLAGGVAVIALFSVVVASEVALSVLANTDRPDLGAIEAVWALHNGLFAVNFVTVAIALIGLARAGVGAGLTPAAFDRLAPIGAGLLAVSAVAAPAIAAGDAMFLLAPGLFGFLVWLVFLIASGRRLVRSAVPS